MTYSHEASFLPTKEKIFYAAVELFSDGGYSEVSMRDIAKRVGINVSSLYNHYASKEELLGALYAFYSLHWHKACPDVGGLMRLAETEPPHAVLARLDFRFDPEIVETLDRIVKIAFRQMTRDLRSEKFIKEHVIESYGSLWVPLLERMIALGRIMPVDVRAVVSIISYYSICALRFNRTSLTINEEEWKTGLNLIFSLIRPAET